MQYTTTRNDEHKNTSSRQFGTYRTTHHPTTTNDGPHVHHPPTVSACRNSGLTHRARHRHRHRRTATHRQRTILAADRHQLAVERAVPIVCLQQDARTRVAHPRQQWGVGCVFGQVDSVAAVKLSVSTYYYLHVFESIGTNTQSFYARCTILPAHNGRRRRARVAQQPVGLPHRNTSMEQPSVRFGNCRRVPTIGE